MLENTLTPSIPRKPAGRAQLADVPEDIRRRPTFRRAVDRLPGIAIDLKLWGPEELRQTWDLSYREIAYLAAVALKERAA